MEAECSKPGRCGNFQNSALGALFLSGTQSSEVMYITEKFHRRCPDSSISIHRLFPSKVIGIVRKEMPLPPP